MRKVFGLLLLFVLITLSFVSCGGGDAPGGEDTDNTLRVMVSADAGAVVTSENPVEVEPGKSASFTVEIKSGYGFVSTSHGTYDIENSTLTIENVTERTNVTFTTEELGYDTNQTVDYVFRGDTGDTTSVKSSPAVRHGTVITVKANNTKRIFAGWSFDALLSNGGTLASTDREFTFRVSPETAPGKSLYVYANYKDSNVFYYDANGGKVNASSVNLAKNDYYTSELDGDKIKITLSEKYYNFSECGCAFYDDGTFKRNGYVLIEYNTQPDGSGESFSIGSKFYTVTGSDYTTLYCIWAKESRASDFEYTDFTYALPSNINAKNAPNWYETGVIITKYNGNDDFIVIPEFISGKPVIAIAKGAFDTKSATKLALSKNLLKIEDGAFVGCSSIGTVYFSDGIYELSDAMFDEATYQSFKKLYVNATIAPRNGGTHSIKLSRLLASENENRIIVVAGSSTYEGLSTTYLEALLDGEYTVVNFGTTRTTHGLIYLEAMQNYAHEGDIIIYAPENSIYMLGERTFYWKTLMDLEYMNNFFRYIDISNYDGVFSAFSNYNQVKRYVSRPRKYEEICNLSSSDKYGDHQLAARGQYNNPDNYIESYYVTLNERCKSSQDVNWDDEEGQAFYKDYTDPNNKTWCSLNSPEYADLVNFSIAAAKSSGAKVYFGFAPVDRDSIVAEAFSDPNWFANYDKLIAETYDFDGIVGSCTDYIYAREYFYDCAYHTNDYGRTYRTYQLYLDLAQILSLEYEYGLYDVGTNFRGCMFEEGSDGTPNIKE